MTKRAIVWVMIGVLAMSSCSIVRGLRADGMYGPDIFSFEKRDVDTIANDDITFQFPYARKSADWIDTSHFYNKVHQCEYMTYLEAFNKESTTQGLLIIHNDSIVYERYWGDFSADRMATIFSVSKSITSLMCGIAVDDGYIRSIDDPVTDYLPELKKEDPMWQKLTIRHLLDMRSGLDFDDTYDVNWKGLKYLNAMARLNYGHNITEQIRGLRFRCEPGTQHRYESMTAAILGVVIERASGKRFADYLSEKVWKPLGMEHPAVVNIDSRKHDNAHTFGGISTTIKDLAKIGRLYLNEGMWEGKRIVSEEWIRQTAECDTSYHGYHFNWYNINYENLTRPEHSGYYALGIKEQVLYVNPHKDLIMVRIGLENHGHTSIPILFEQLSLSWPEVQGKRAEGDAFHLTKQGAHYVFNASINGIAEPTILVESGIPALLVDSAYVFNSGMLSDMELTVADKEEKLNLAGRVYKITHKANGTVKIGNNTSYVGEVFVLSNYDYGNYEVAVPVMYLHNDLDDGSRIVNLDLGNQNLQMLSRASLNAKKKTYSEGRMNTNTYMGLPAIETSVTLDDGGKTRTLNGNFFIDFGNPELLFLFHQTKEVQKFLADNADLELRDAIAPNGEVVGQFILTKQLHLLGITFPNAVVVITKNLPLFTAPGNIGLKFFEKADAIFDFDESVIYMK